MNKKINLLFGVLYFCLIVFGHIANLLTSLTDLLLGNVSIYIFYHDYIVVGVTNILRLIIYILGALSLGKLYKKINKHEKISFEKKEPLPIRKKIILYLFTLITLTLVSILASWQIKILADLGEKYNIYVIYVKLTQIAAFCAELFLMCKALVHFDIFSDNNFKRYNYFSFSSIFILFTYSIYSLITDFSIYQIVFIPFTLSLGFVYPYCEKRFSITYLITLLVFLF